MPFTLNLKNDISSAVAKSDFIDDNKMEHKGKVRKKMCKIKGKIKVLGRIISDNVYAGFPIKLEESAVNYLV